MKTAVVIGMGPERGLGGATVYGSGKQGADRVAGNYRSLYVPVPTTAKCLDA